MATTNVPLVATASGAVTGTAAASGDGNNYENDGNVRLLMYNPDLASQTITVSVPSTTDDKVDGNVVPDLAISGVSDLFYLLKALPVDVYNQLSGTDTGKVVVTITGTIANVELFAIRPK